MVHLLRPGDLEVDDEGLDVIHRFQFLFNGNHPGEAAFALCLRKDDSQLLHVGLASGFHHLGVLLIKFALFTEVGIAHWANFGRKGREPAFFADASILSDLCPGLLELNGKASAILESEGIVPVLEGRIHGSAVVLEKFQEPFPRAGEIDRALIA